MTDSTTVGAPAQPTSHTPEKLALIWIPGFGSTAEQSVTVVAAHVAQGLDAAYAEQPGSFGSDGQTHSEKLDPSNTSADAPQTQCCGITQTVEGGGTPRAVADVWSLPTADVVRGDVASAKGLRKVLLIAYALVTMTVRLVRLIRGGKALTRKAVWQLVFGCGLIAAALLALIVAIVSVLGFGVQALSGTSVFGFDLTTLGITAATATAIVGALNRYGKAAVDGAAVFAGAAAYLETDTRKDELLSSLTKLMEKLEGLGYDAFVVVSYSFGSLVAVDGHFRQSADTNLPSYRRTKALVTIGFPFDFVRRYWPEYFTGRTALVARDMPWTNVCRPGDVFGSNFRDDDSREGPADDIGVLLANGGGRRAPANAYRPNAQTKGLTVPATFVLQGLKLHAGYWGEATGGEDAFKDVANVLQANALIPA